MLSIPTGTADPYHSFIENVGFLIRTLSLLKALVNYACLCLGSGNLLSFMKCATLFEKSISPVPIVVKRDWSRTLFNVALRTTMGVSLVSVFVTSRMLSSANPNVTLKYLPVGREAVALCSDIAFFLYDSIVYATVTRCSEVLVQYLKFEVARLEAHQLGDMSAATEQWNSVAIVATVRVNVCKIKTMKTCLNDTCSPAIVTSTACLLIFMCVNLQRLFILKPDEVLFWLSVGYMAYCACCLIDMVFVSEDLEKEVRSNSVP
ncbi:hypothetical protein HPB52_012696 [Rhipicephalus sanguineus]|uniref:Uncharacterized protein n=1 Tax=Rhipicephalus sanguineus TaxID=34632 RepID=A0A9D4SQ57_RHISA|nr:hypothetical protein HPB52_012696 [Rhipicephalus sanguineus]